MESATKKRIAIILVIATLLVLFGFYFSKYYKEGTPIKPAGNEEMPQEQDKATETEAPQDYEQIKKDVATGKIADVPLNFNETKELVVLEYLSDCYFEKNIEKKVKCYEEYYVGNDQGINQRREDCKALTGIDSEKCLDQFYYKLGTESSRIFCSGIKNAELKNECEEQSE